MKSCVYFTQSICYDTAAVLYVIGVTVVVYIQVISGHTGWVRCVAVEPGNQWFATGKSIFTELLFVRRQI